MPVRIYDTMARDKVELTRASRAKLSMYVCGPTVYDVPHVGHGRTAVVFDVIRRYLEWTGLDVTFVSNVTDVEDKIIRRASETGHDRTGDRRSASRPRTGTRWTASACAARRVARTRPSTSRRCSS